MPLSAAQQLRSFSRVLFPFGVALLLLMEFFVFLPVYFGTNAASFYQASLQLTRASVLARSAVVFAYRPDDEKAQALADLQTALPIFEQEQNRLKSDPRPDVQIALATVGPDYLAIDTAVRALLKKPDGPADPIQIEIILAHDRNYRIGMNTVILIIQQSIDRQITGLFVIETIIDGIMLALLIVFWIREQMILSQLIARLKGE